MRGAQADIALQDKQAAMTRKDAQQKEVTRFLDEALDRKPPERAQAQAAKTLEEEREQARAHLEQREQQQVQDRQNASDLDRKPRFKRDLYGRER